MQSLSPFYRGHKTAFGVGEGGGEWGRCLEAKAPASHGNRRSNNRLASWAVSGGGSGRSAGGGRTGARATYGGVVAGKGAAPPGAVGADLAQDTWSITSCRSKAAGRMSLQTCSGRESRGCRMVLVFPIFLSPYIRPQRRSPDVPDKSTHVNVYRVTGSTAYCDCWPARHRGTALLKPSSRLADLRSRPLFPSRCEGSESVPLSGRPLGERQALAGNRKPRAEPTAQNPHSSRVNTEPLG